LEREGSFDARSPWPPVAAADAADGRRVPERGWSLWWVLVMRSCSDGSVRDDDVANLCVRKSSAAFGPRDARNAEDTVSEEMGMAENSRARAPSPTATVVPGAEIQISLASNKPMAHCSLHPFP